MATNGKVGDGRRNGQVSNRSQTYNSKNDTWVKRNSDNGQFMNVKSNHTPFKGVRKENKS